MIRYGLQESHMEKYQNFIFLGYKYQYALLNIFVTFSHKNLQSASPVLNNAVLTAM